MDDLVRDLSILGVDAAASPTQVQERYRELVRRWHPDRFAGDPQGRAEATLRMRQIDDAYRRVTARQSWASGGGVRTLELPAWIQVVNRLSARLGMAAALATGVWLIVAAALTKVDYFVTDAHGYPADPLVNPVFQGVTGATAFIAFLVLLWVFRNK
jgi:DnaJ domain